MIILDTNVLSELIRQAPNLGVVTWLDELPASEVFTTAITAAELLYGVTRLPEGQRKTALTAAVHELIRDDFAGRVEPFDAHAAEHYAILATERERLGRPISVADAQIAAICLSRHGTLATRNIKDFTDTGLDLVNPWHTD